MSVKIHLALLLAAAMTAAVPALILAKETTVTSATQNPALAAMTLDDAEAAFGAPVETDAFPLARELPEFRTDLPDRATPGEVAGRAQIREVTWDLSAEQNRTIWFIERDGAWRYLHHMDWAKGTEF